jgi:hypothetical protein
MNDPSLAVSLRRFTSHVSFAPESSRGKCNYNRTQKHNNPPLAARLPTLAQRAQSSKYYVSDCAGHARCEGVP